MTDCIDMDVDGGVAEINGSASFQYQYNNNNIAMSSCNRQSMSVSVPPPSPSPLRTSSKTSAMSSRSGASRCSIVTPPRSARLQSKGRKRRRHQSDFRSTETIHYSSRSRRRATTTTTFALSRLSLLLLLCHFSPVVIGSRSGSGHHHSSIRKRRNNTGFYYGIRDDDMASSATSSSSPSLSSSVSSRLFQPGMLLNSLSSRLHNSMPSHFSTLTRSGKLGGEYDYNDHTMMEEKRGAHHMENNDPSTTPASKCADTNNSLQHHRLQTPPSTSTTSEQTINNEHHHESSIYSSYNKSGRALGFRDKLAQSLMQTLLLPCDQQQQWYHLREQQNANNNGINNGVLDSMVGKAISLFGGGVYGSAVSQLHPQHHLLLNDNNNNNKAIVHTAAAASTKLITKPQQKTMKQQQKQQQQQRTRRKNNTGFYYGIRDDDAFGKKRMNSKGRQHQAGGKVVPKDADKDAIETDSHDISIMEEQTTTPPTMPFDKQKSQQQLDGPSKKKRQKHPRSKPDNKNKVNTKKRASTNEVHGAPGMSDVFSETLFELREMKEEIISLRAELRAVKEKFKRDQEEEEEAGATTKERSSPGWRRQQQQQLEEDRQKGKGDESTTAIIDEPEPFQVQVQETKPPPPPPQTRETPEKKSVPKQRARRREFEEIGKDVEQWANELLFEQEDRAGDGFKQISCNKIVKKKFNKSGRTQVYLKWMPDTRDEKDIESTSSQTQDYPCLKCYSTIDAPLHQVCSFLANEETMPLYNELVTDHSDVEEITPHSKITWTKAPKILFVKPRDFVTYCSHRWGRDGTQVLINQACEHEDKPGVLVEGQGDACRGFALRGANFISKDPDDPNKTRITMLSHANPGGGLPQWAMNTAVNAVVQIEPFKFFHNMNDSIRNYQESSPAISDSQSQTSNVGNLPGRSNKPAGIAHLGFTCFWPNGGGLKESSNPFANNQPKQDMLWESEEEDDDDEEDEDAMESLED